MSYYDFTRLSDPCTYCGFRGWLVGSETRDSGRVRHEAGCALSIDCGYCQANKGQPCVVRGTMKHCSTHEARKFIARTW